LFRLRSIGLSSMVAMLEFFIYPGNIEPKRASKDDDERSWRPAVPAGHAQFSRR
jgi:hypothetical protein